MDGTGDMDCTNHKIAEVATQMDCNNCDSNIQTAVQNSQKARQGIQRVVFAERAVPEAAYNIRQKR
jgi:hypothetical protein